MSDAKDPRVEAAEKVLGGWNGTGPIRRMLSGLLAYVQELESYRNMYMLCNEREQQLLAIKETADRFVGSYQHNYCWIENGSEVTSDLLDNLIAALRKGGPND